MRHPCRCFMLSAALCLLCAQAFAGAGISNISVRKEPNLTSVAVQAIVSGDDDSSAVLRIFQKWRESPSYDTGMVLVRRVGTRIHEGRILWMNPGRTADFFIEGRDASGNFVTLVQQASVQPVRPLIATGPVFYVDQRLGDDAWTGARPGSGNGASGPKRTINAALAALAASPNAGRNGGVFVAPGEYHERITLAFGSDGDHHFLEGDGSNRDSTIVCGANPWVERGMRAPGLPLLWALTQDSTYVTRLEGSTAGSSPGDSTQLMVIGWGEYLHRKTSVRAVLNDSTFNGLVTSTNAGELSGWFWQHDSLYVKRRNGQTPAGITLHAGYLDNLIDVQRRNWRIANLTVRFSGSLSGDPTHRANPDPPLYGHGIVAGVSGVASGLVVDSCRFYGHNSDAIFVVHGALGGHADSVTIANSIVDGLTVGSMAYGAGKGRAEEDVGQITLLSRASNVYKNVITGGFNGLGMGSGDPVAGPRDSTCGSQDEVAFNTIASVADDAIELDTTHGINTLLFGNTLRDVGHGLSLVPTYTGPTWVFYNTVANSRAGGIKVGSGTKGITWFVQNTVTASNPGSAAIDGSPGGTADHLHFRNNVLVASADGLGYAVSGPNAASRISNDFNYDLMDSPITQNLVSWGGQLYSLAQLQSLLGWERNGMCAAPSYVDSTKSNWALRSTSAGIGRGQRITGVNTSLDGPRYVGQPDIGAQAMAPTTATSPLEPGPGASLAVRASPNPFRDDALIEYSLPAAAEVSICLYDIGGRVVRTLADHAQQAAGSYRLPLQGRALSPGIYLYKVSAGREHVQGKLVLIR